MNHRFKRISSELLFEMRLPQPMNNRLRKDDSLRKKNADIHLHFLTKLKLN